MRTSTRTQLIARTLVGGVLAGTLTLPAAAALAAAPALAGESGATPGFENRTVVVEVGVASTCLTGLADCPDITVDFSWDGPALDGAAQRTLPATGGTATFTIPKEAVVPDVITYTVLATQGAASWDDADTVEVRPDSDVPGTIDGALGEVAEILDDPVGAVEGARGTVEQKVQETVDEVQRQIDESDIDGKVSEQTKPVADLLRNNAPGETIRKLTQGGTVEKAIAGTVTAVGNAPAAGGTAATGLARALSYEAGRAAEAAGAAAWQTAGMARPWVDALIDHVESLAAPITGAVGGISPDPVKAAVDTFLAALHAIVDEIETPACDALSDYGSEYGVTCP